MRILSCHIENFGKLKDLTIEFSDDLRVIHEDNGWGKSTLAAFIKVMFYGFAGEGKRSEADNERRKYRPWQGGVYGGRITFQVKGTIYEFVRTFGIREREDTFHLYDRKTNLHSDAYTSEIGAELFQIDRESFARTVFIAQSDTATNATDSINAKIGNLAENTDDINNYDTVRERFRKLQNNLSPTRSTGLIRRKKEDIARLENNISRGSVIDEALEELTDKLQLRKAEKERLKEEQAAVRKLMEQVSSYKDLQSGKEAYERVCAEYLRAVGAATEAGHFFPAAVPSGADLVQMQEEADRLAGYQGELQSVRLTEQQQFRKKELEKQFNSGFPDPDALSICRQKIKEHADLEIEIARTKPGAEDEERLKYLEQEFGGRPPEDLTLNRYVALWNRRNERISRLGADQAALKMLRTMSVPSPGQGEDEEPKKEDKAGKNGFKVMRLLGIAAIGIGLLGVTGNLLPFLTGAAIGTGIIIILATFLLNGEPDRPDRAVQNRPPQDTEKTAVLERRIAEAEKEIQGTEADLRAFFEQYGITYTESGVITDLYGLKEKGQDYQELLRRRQRYADSGLETERLNLDHEIRAFLQYYVPAYEMSGDDYLTAIQRLEDCRSEYSRLEAQADRYKRVRAGYDSSCQLIREFVAGLGYLPATNLAVQLREIYDHVRSLTAAQNLVREKQQEKAVFEQKEDIRRYEHLVPGSNLPSMEELNQHFDEISSGLDVIDEQIASYSRQVDAKTEEKGLIEEEEGQLHRLKEELAEDLHRYGILLKTKDFLEQAKESFTARYIGPVMNGFKKYYLLLTGREAADYQIDANINITAREHGEHRDLRLLSAGSQDLIGICMRMALVDAMFPDEKPFIVIDDAFVNLDDDKVRGGMKFLAEVAKEYQVIYFTCHESRM